MDNSLQPIRKWTKNHFIDNQWILRQSEYAVGNYNEITNIFLAREFNITQGVHSVNVKYNLVKS